MFYPKIHEQTILEISQGDSINATADSFLIDRQGRELSKYTLKFYREFLRTFLEYCNADSVTFIQEITPGFLRRYLKSGVSQNTSWLSKKWMDVI